MTITGIWDLRGSLKQQRLVKDALAVCSFPFDRLLPSLQKEGKNKIIVEWKDLSKYGAAAAAAATGEHQHIHEGDAVAHPLVRKIAGRMRVLGLFYIPPYTKIVLDNSLVYYPSLTKEVFLSESAHAVDYHYMTNKNRLVFWNAIHPDQQDLPEGQTIAESGDLGHGHSWFDGPMGYNTWVGESWMEGFVKTFSPTVPVTIKLAHSMPSNLATIMKTELLGAPVVAAQTTRVFTPIGSRTFHTSHKGIAQYKWYPSIAAAIGSGLRPCSVCV